MDAYEATRVVLSRIQSLDPENAPKIMGLLLLQEHGENEMIRLAFGPETLLQSVVLKAKKELGLAPPSSAPCTPPVAGGAASPFLLRQKSASRLLSGGLPPPPLTVSSPSSWAPPSVFSGSNSSGGGNGLNMPLDELLNSDELISPGSLGVSPFYGCGGDLIDEFRLPDQLSFLGDPTAAATPTHSLSLASTPSGGDVFPGDIECRSPSSNGDGSLFPNGLGWGVNGYLHRRSCSAADLSLGDAAAGFGWKPCLYFARGYCKNGAACRFLHGLPEEAAGTKMDAVVEQQCQELLLRSKSQRIGGASQLVTSAFPYSPTGSMPPSPSSSSSSKCLSFLLQQQQNDSQRAAAAAAALMLGGEEAHRFMARSRMERSDLMGNPGSRQIYLTFPADSTFREEDVSNYFSIYGPVQDVRIPYQQKRMFGFVTFVYPDTVKLILAKGNPHFVRDSRVLVKPYKEKGKVPDKYRHSSLLNLHQNHVLLNLQQQAERSDPSGCTTPTAIDAREAYDLQQLGARMLYNSSSVSQQLLRRKLEERQQAAEALQRAIELQGRRFMGLQFLDLNSRSLSSSAPACINSPTITTVTQSSSNVDSSCNGSISSSSQEGSPTKDKCLGVAAPEEKVNSFLGLLHKKAENEESAGEANLNEDGDFQESAEHNLPDSPFASPTKSAFSLDSFSTGEDMSASYIPSNNSSSSRNNNNNNKNNLIAATLLPTTSSLDKSSSLSPCFLQMPRFSSGHGAIGM
ncbi:zinc finger CCCH domain-containing protein [Musa troglodytarum]|uniref:Zinc finger CCCH domain-containing protein n=1 Tax=Musa troglodytarum TaxID=320322 RepID=A0A9E7LCQ2_9LILI|nr:zinc finger CCCH domain-containing protein [Musa troglodytarum]